MRKVSYISLGVFLFAWWVVSISYSSHLEDTGFEFSSFKAKAGDMPAWKDADFDDSSWSYLFPKYGAEEIWWMRFDMKIHQALEMDKKYGLRLSVSAPHEVFFDGVYLGNNGQVFPQSSLSGLKYQKLYFIPDSLVYPGSHKLSIRLASNMWNWHESPSS